MDDSRELRWRLILGKEDQDVGGGPLTGEFATMDAALEALYDQQKRGGLGPSQPNVARWLGDIRTYFPSSVVQIMQRDAIDRLGLDQLLLEPESLRAVQPDVHLVATLLSLKSAMSPETRETARAVIRVVVGEIIKRLREPMRQAVTGAVNRGQITKRPRFREIDWHRTIRRNLKHYQPELRTVIPESLVGYGRKGPKLKHVILAIDQSGSMAPSVVYGGIFSSVLAMLPSLKTHIVAFDTEVADLSEHCSDPVELLMATRLGGGTDIGKALTYCSSLVTTPTETVLIVISDLFEGAAPETMFKRFRALKQSGVKVLVLLALDDRGTPIYDRDTAESLAQWGIPSFACTPDAFPEVLAQQLKG